MIYLTYDAKLYNNFAFYLASDGYYKQNNPGIIYETGTPLSEYKYTFPG